MNQNLPLTIFYSWQSDLPRETSQQVIRSCIRSSFNPIEVNDESLQFILDEATRNEAGSPDIPATIFNKISLADIFICDITIINSSEKSTRKTPNPNVLIELGYAISILGWERIIMVFNKYYYDSFSELPFDLNKRRIIPFKVVRKDDKNGISDLTNKLTTAIETIIKKNPLKPNEIRGRSEQELKKEKDIANLKILMSCIHIQTLDLFISELPHKLIGGIFFFWHSFQGNYDSNTFHIYDSVLNEKLFNFRNSWENTLNFENLFRPLPNGKDFIFHMPFDVFQDEQTESGYNELRGEGIRLGRFFKELIIYIRENYLEVELNELSEQAKKQYIDFEKEILDKLENN